MNKGVLLSLILILTCLTIGCGKDKIINEVNNQEQYITKNTEDLDVTELITFLNEAKNKEEIDTYLGISPFAVKNAENPEQIVWRYEVKKSSDYEYTGVEA